MSEDRHIVKVNIFGNEYTIRGAADEQYIQDLARYVDSKMKEIAQTTNLNIPLKISILAAINLADEIFSLRAREDKKTSGVSPTTNTAYIAPKAITALAAHIAAVLKEE